MPHDMGMHGTSSRTRIDSFSRQLRGNNGTKYKIHFIHENLYNKREQMKLKPELLFLTKFKIK